MNDLPEANLSNILQSLSRVLSVLGPSAQSQLGIRHDPSVSLTPGVGNIILTSTTEDLMS